MHVTYSMFVVLLMGHIFHFFKRWINMLLQYLQIIIVNEKVINWLFCKQFVTLTSFGLYVVQFLMERQRRVYLFIYLSTTLNMINFMRVKCDGLGFENNPLFTQRCNYAYQYYLLHNSKLIDKKMDTIMFNQQMNVEFTLKMLLEF